MSDDEIVNYILKNEQINPNLRIATILNILANAMIQKGWFTEDEFNKAAENGLKQMVAQVVNDMPKETKEAIEMQSKIEENDLFGAVFKDFLK